MKTLLRDRKTIYYSNPTGSGDQLDEYGNITGVEKTTFSAPERYDRLSAMNPKGLVRLEPYGLSEGYTLTMVTHDMNCPITSESRVWIGKSPYDGLGNLTPYTHAVKRVWPTVNAIRIEFEEVSTS